MHQTRWGAYSAPSDLLAAFKGDVLLRGRKKGGKGKGG